MFQLRAEQFSEITARCEIVFERQLSARLRTQLPDLLGSEPERQTQSRVSRLVADAHRHQIICEDDVAEFVLLCLLYPAQLTGNVDPDVLEILDYPSRPAKRKLRFLHQYLESAQPRTAR